MVGRVISRRIDLSSMVNMEADSTAFRGRLPAAAKAPARLAEARFAREGGRRPYAMASGAGARASRTFDVSPLIENGFATKCMVAASTPWRRTASSE